MCGCPIGAAAAAEGAGLSRQDQEEGAVVTAVAFRSVGQRRAASLMQALACLPLCTLVRRVLCQGSALKIRA